MLHRDTVRKDVERGEDRVVVSRKIYLSFPTSVFLDDYPLEFDIKNEIHMGLDVPFMSIQIVGSSKTGYSYVHDREFIPGESDLDVAIIDKASFIEMLDYTHELTNGYSNDELFVHPNHATRFRAEIKYGSITPYFLPIGDLREKWIIFFRTLSNKHSRLFGNINAKVYASQFLFEMAQYRAIEEYFKEV